MADLCAALASRYSSARSPAHGAGRAGIGRDASTLDRVDGVEGEPGRFGLQAGNIEVVGVKSHARSATGGNFGLKGMKLDVSLDGQTCF
ncbi:DUF6230 family protein [Streptomyces sp. NBC_00249]|uniref:DUF6230 family protein n=1 Tax=Streptomyces sp. NBC_00249 TaxID=2975690 RepID=UPI002B1DFCE0|nr:DUF6230 family protein [Streptomyces sp. NBC_00249]